MMEQSINMIRQKLKPLLVLATIFITLALGACNPPPMENNVSTFADWQNMTEAQQQNTTVNQEIGQIPPEQEVDISCQILS